MSEVYHAHIIIRCEAKTFFNKKEGGEFADWIVTLVERLKMNLMIGPIINYVSREGLRGWTGIAAIETSSITVHVWDEPTPNVIQMDVYTCGCLDVDTVLESLKQFDPVTIEYLLLDREKNIVLKEYKCHTTS